jgi:hypothetical protein
MNYSKKMLYACLLPAMSLLPLGFLASFALSYAIVQATKRADVNDLGYGLAFVVSQQIALAAFMVAQIVMLVLIARRSLSASREAYFFGLRIESVILALAVLLGAVLMWRFCFDVGSI